MGDLRPAGRRGWGPGGSRGSAQWRCSGSPRPQPKIPIPTSSSARSATTILLPQSIYFLQAINKVFGPFGRYLMPLGQKMMASSSFQLSLCCVGLFVMIWIATVVFKSNDILRKQTALKIQRSGKLLWWSSVCCLGK
ncbi:uncharacterized protein LOC125556412 isoform X1 [Triticum urartu]|uniref:uncharacterized protein LOC125556412 isoform X1 n=1 Tax=Triticum urartu TaxID=4572 RepID=UPI002043144D|nr:uncharacterized protein LOC125556412 isoform X1 [Triticum urartu]